MPLHQEIGPVKIYSPTRPEGVWQITWAPPGLLRQVKQRKTKAKALALAKEIRGQLKRGEIGRVHRITKEEAEWIRLCRILDDPKRVLDEAIARQEAFGRRISIAEACERYRKEYEKSERTATVKDAKSRAKVIENTLGERFLDSLLEKDIEEWRSNLNGLSSCLLPEQKPSGSITGRRTQRDMSLELRNAGIIENWPKD